MDKNISAEFSWVDRVHKRFKEVGDVIPVRQRKLYEKIRDEFAMGKTIIDAGCSLGVGSNILAHYARFVWGVDINEEAIKYAQCLLKRPNLDFMVMNLENTPTRELAKFDIVTMVEVLEHLENIDLALNNIKRFFNNDTIGFFTFPNNANEEVKINEAKHGLHIQHMNAGQFYEVMTRHFRSVVLYSVDKLEKWDMGETVDGDSTDYLIVAKVEGII